LSVKTGRAIQALTREPREQNIDNGFSYCEDTEGPTEPLERFLFTQYIG